MADDQGKGAGKQALAPDVLAARAAEQRERDAAAFAEREYDLARQAAAANAAGRVPFRVRFDNNNTIRTLELSLQAAGTDG